MLESSASSFPTFSVICLQYSAGSVSFLPFQKEFVLFIYFFEIVHKNEFQKLTVLLT